MLYGHWIDGFVMERLVGPGLADWSGIGGFVNLPGIDVELADFGICVGLVD